MERRSRMTQTETTPQHGQKQRGRRIPVVYYLSRNMHLEHPHFIEVPCSSEGLYLRDVISKLNSLRGKGMAAMYSWSCKRSYKSGFVWQDLSVDDLILPAQGNEYVLKGSEVPNTSPSDRPNPTLKTFRHLNHGSPSASSQDGSPTCPELVLKEVKPPRRAAPAPAPPTPGPDCDLSPESQANSPWRHGGALNVSTQTDDRVGGDRRDLNAMRTRGVSTDEASDLKFEGSRRIRTKISKESSEISADEISPPPTSSSVSSSGGKTETLETLIRADARKMSSLRMAEEAIHLHSATKIKAADVLMQLITCGSISVKDSDRAGIVSTYRPRISRVKLPSPGISSSRITVDLDDLLLENRRTRAGRRMEEKEFFSGSLIETKNRKEGKDKVIPTLKRSSSYNEERSCKSAEREKEKKPGESGRSKGLRRTPKGSSSKHSKKENENENETKTKVPCPDGRTIFSEGRDAVSSRRFSKRFTEVSPAMNNSSRAASFREEKERVIKIDERLTSGARVVIHSTATCRESEEDSSSS